MTTNQTMTTDDQAELRELALDILRDEPEPISTNELADRLGLSPFQRSAYLWRQLDRLAKRGTIRRIRRDGHYCRFWKVAEP